MINEANARRDELVTARDTLTARLLGEHISGILHLQNISKTIHYHRWMPERARIFTLSESVARVLAATPALTARVHRFLHVTGVEVPPSGLFVARMPDDSWSTDEFSPAPHRDPVFELMKTWGPGRPVQDFSHAMNQISWLSSVWPPQACLRFLRRLATPSHPIAYYHQMERGDDLYYEFSWLAGDTEHVTVRQTFLVGDGETSVMFHPHGSEPAHPTSALLAAWAHIGLSATAQFFDPEDGIPQSDWPGIDV